MDVKLLSPRQYFEARPHRPRKRLGQHFLEQPATARKIVESADLKPDEPVVEVGPGLGALTQFLVPRVSRLHLVELDSDLAEYLAQCLAESAPHVRVHRQDVLSFDWVGWSRMYGAPLVLVGNLPYNISSPLLFGLLAALGAIDRAVFMVQKEVGERWAAGPGSKEYGVLSVLLGIYTTVRLLFTVSPAQFHPPPKVDSVVVRIDFRPDPPTPRSAMPALRTLLNTAFQQRRKTIANALKPMVRGSKGTIEAMLRTAGIDPMQRPETLTPEDYIQLAGKLTAYGM